MRKIKIKLSHHQLAALTGYLYQCITNDQPYDRTEMIRLLLVYRLYMKFKARTLYLESRTYTFSIELEIAFAFVEYFNGRGFDDAYTGPVVLQLMGSMDAQLQGVNSGVINI